MFKNCNVFLPHLFSFPQHVKAEKLAEAEYCNKIRNYGLLYKVYVLL